MRALILSTLVAGATALSALPASAMNAQPLVDTGTELAPTLVAQGCGPGFHRGYYGNCRPNYYGGGYYGGGPRFYGPRYYGGGYYRPRYYGGYGLRFF